MRFISDPTGPGRARDRRPRVGPDGRKRVNPAFLPAAIKKNKGKPIVGIPGMPKPKPKRRPI